MKYIAPLIVVEDIRRARNFYENVLTQKVKTDYGENITFEGDFSIHLKDHFQALINDRLVISRSNGFFL